MNFSSLKSLSSACSDDEDVVPVASEEAHVFRGTALRATKTSRITEKCESHTAPALMSRDTRLDVDVDEVYHGSPWFLRVPAG
jgi:hypothetical protein